MAWSELDRVRQAERERDNERSDSVQIALKTDHTRADLGEHWFLPYTLSRSSYFLRVLACCFLPVLPVLVVGLQHRLLTMGLILFLLLFVLVYKVAVLNTARARDCGKSATFGLTPLIPLVGIYFQLYLFFAASE